MHVCMHMHMPYAYVYIYIYIYICVGMCVCVYVCSVKQEDTHQLSGLYQIISLMKDTPETFKSRTSPN